MALEPRKKWANNHWSLRAVYVASAIQVMLLAGCGGGLHLDSGATADMQRCGVDIRMSNEFRLDLLNDARDKKLSLATVEELKSTIFNQVPEASRLAVYQSYVDCITSRRALNAALLDIEQRKAALASKLRDRYHVAENDVLKINAYYDREAGQLRTGQIIAARETRAAMIYELATIAARNKIALNLEDIIATGGRLADGEQGAGSGGQQATRGAGFLKACLAAADEILCRSMVPVYNEYELKEPPSG